MGNRGPILLGQNVTPRFPMHAISTIILAVLANFIGIIIQFFRKASVVTMATLATALVLAERTKVQKALYTQPALLVLSQLQSTLFRTLA